MMRVGSLFSGIGGIDLGLERVGFEIAWQVEVDPYCQQVLAKHWPDVKRYGDIRDINPEDLESVDVVAGGFPCQNLSKASVSRTGIDGAKSGLWSDMHRIISVVRPRYVLVENVTDLRHLGLDRVVGDLAQIGYDAEWDCLPAAAFGAPHIRDRIYLLAYPGGERYGTPGQTIFAGWSSAQLHGGWDREPRLGRVADGLPRGVVRDRLRGIGNAVCPPVIEWIGRRMLEGV